MPAGELESRQESFGGLGAAILVAAFGVLAILVLEFRTFKSTLIVASVIPLGVIGGLVALFLSGNTLSFTANVGFVALMGIEVKNSILLVDFTNQLRARRACRSTTRSSARARRASCRSCSRRSRRSAGSSRSCSSDRASTRRSRSSSSAGSSSSTLLARVVTPVLYKLLAPTIEPNEAAASAPRDANAEAEAASVAVAATVRS